MLGHNHLVPTVQRFVQRIMFVKLRSLSAESIDLSFWLWTIDSMAQVTIFLKIVCIVGTIFHRIQAGRHFTLGTWDSAYYCHLATW